MRPMYRRLALVALIASTTLAAQDIVSDVRAVIAQNDYKAGENLISKFKTAKGVTPEMIEAVSWLGRGALAAKQFDAAYGYAEQARELALAELKRRKLDTEPHLPLALGASIEVQAHVMAAKGDLGDAVGFLRRELATYRTTSIRPRIQKNLHLLSLEGKPAPALEVKNWLGPKPASLTELERQAGPSLLLGALVFHLQGASGRSVEGRRRVCVAGPRRCRTHAALWVYERGFRCASGAGNRPHRCCEKAILSRSRGHACPDQ